RLLFVRAADADAYAQDVRRQVEVRAHSPFEPVHRISRAPDAGEVGHPGVAEGGVEYDTVIYQVELGARDGRDGREVRAVQEGDRSCSLPACVRRDQGWQREDDEEDTAEGRGEGKEGAQAEQASGHTGSVKSGWCRSILRALLGRCRAV